VEDYAVFFQVCREVRGWFGHVTSLAAKFSPATINWGNCQSYDTADETVQSCTASKLDIKFAAGEALGTGSRAGCAAIDFGLTDARVTHFYVVPERHPPDCLHAVCMWELFDAANQAVLFSNLRDPARNVAPRGEPRCGTLQVDVAGTVPARRAAPGSSRNNLSGRAKGSDCRRLPRGATRT
jgi:hypothetical protein